jgi:hypothetical protein
MVIALDLVHVVATQHRRDLSGDLGDVIGRAIFDGPIDVEMIALAVRQARGKTVAADSNALGRVVKCFVERPGDVWALCYAAVDRALDEIFGEKTGNIGAEGRAVFGLELDRIFVALAVKEFSGHIRDASRGSTLSKQDGHYPCRSMFYRISGPHPGDHMREYMAQNKDADLVRRGLLLIADTRIDLEAMIRERDKAQSGMAPLRPSTQNPATGKAEHHDDRIRTIGGPFAVMLERSRPKATSSQRQRAHVR